MTTMPASKLDDFPEDFTLEDLKKGLTPQELEAIQADTEIALPDPDAAPPQQAKAEPEPAPVATPEPAPAPKIVVPDTAEATAKVAKADEDLASIAERYDAGELTRAEMLEAQKAIIAEQAKAQLVIEQAAQAEQQIAKTVEEQWFAAGAAFKAAGNEVLWSADHLKGWDQALRTVSGTAAYQDLPMERMYELARDFYAADYKARTGQTLPISGGTKPAAAQPSTPRTDPRDPPVQTLAGINGDATDMVTDGTFASIDKMMDVDPIRAEQMIAALPKAQQEKYFASA